MLTIADGSRSSVRAALRLLTVIVAGAALLSVAFVPGLAVTTDRVTSAVEDIIQPVDLPTNLPVPNERSRILAADGSLIGYFVGAENRVIVRLDDVGQTTIDAVLAAEDADFYEHNGVDHQAVLRALVANVRSGDVEQGGSTITQQYVKNALLTPEQTIQRKLTEVATAVQLERDLTKDQILERYLNIAYFGNGAYGIEAAAQFYFGKSADELAPHEAALLAGLIRSPADLEPIGNPEAAKQRRNQVLEAMVGMHGLTRDEVEAAKQRPDEVVAEPPPTPKYPFFAEYVKQLLLSDPALGETRADRARLVFGGGLTIQTTLVPSLHEAAIATVREHLPDPLHDPMGALVTVEPGTGRVLAMGVGPETFGECPPEVQQAPSIAERERLRRELECTQTKVNPVVPLAGGSGRQLGSAFKPILDLTALSNGFATFTTQPGSGPYTIEDERCTGPDGEWEVDNYSRGGPRFLDMVEAIRTSNNVYHANMITDVGIEPVIRMARSLGITTPLPQVCSLALGVAEVFPLQVAEAYATIANRGVHCESFAIEEVTTPDGDSLIANQPTCDQVVERQVADTMTTMLELNARQGTGTRANLPRPDAGKTGTTQDWRDAWYAGFVPQLTTIAWVGYELPTCPEGVTTACGSMFNVEGWPRVFGGSIPAEMWHDYMTGAVEGLDEVPLPLVHLIRGNERPDELEPTAPPTPLLPPPPETSTNQAAPGGEG